MMFFSQCFPVRFRIEIIRFHFRYNIGIDYSDYGFIISNLLAARSFEKINYLGLCIFKLAAIRQCICASKVFVK